MGSKPLKRSPRFDSGSSRGPNSLMRSLIALMCAGVVPASANHIGKPFACKARRRLMYLQAFVVARFSGIE